jgi:hypothetical protein
MAVNTTTLEGLKRPENLVKAPSIADFRVCVAPMMDWMYEAS